METENQIKENIKLRKTLNNTFDTLVVRIQGFNPNVIQDNGLTLVEELNAYESTRAVCYNFNSNKIIITSEYNMVHVKEFLEKRFGKTLIVLYEYDREARRSILLEETGTLFKFGQKIPIEKKNERVLTYIVFSIQQTKDNIIYGLYTLSFGASILFLEEETIKKHIEDIRITNKEFVDHNKVIDSIRLFELKVINLDEDAESLRSRLDFAHEHDCPSLISYYNTKDVKITKYEELT